MKITVLNLRLCFTYNYKYEKLTDYGHMRLSDMRLIGNN